jgi:hypothetical protein
LNFLGKQKFGNRREEGVYIRSGGYGELETREGERGSGEGGFNVRGAGIFVVF